MSPRVVLSAAVLLFLALGVSARADLKWESTNAFASAAPSQGPATALFSFANTGSYPVKIVGTQTSCGCTAAAVDKKVFAPGEKGQIHVSFKTLNRDGLYQEPIKVETDDPAAKETVLSLRILVKNAISIDPEFLFWKAGEGLDAKAMLVSVTDGYIVKGLEAKVDGTHFQVAVQTVEPGATYRVVVTPKSAHVQSNMTITPQIEGRTMKGSTAHLRAG